MHYDSPKELIMRKRTLLILVVFAMLGAAAVCAAQAPHPLPAHPADLVAVRFGFRPADNLHPVEQGYEIWASAVAPTLRSWVK